MKQTKRKYGSKDTYMLDVAAAMHQAFMENITDFESFDNNFNTNFTNLWLAKINEAYAFIPASQLKDILKQKIDEVNALLKQCREKYHKVNFFVNKAFAQNDKHRQMFGSTTFNQYKKSAPTMIAFMEELYTTSFAYKNNLMASGMVLAEIEEIATLKNLLLTKYTETQNFKKVKKELTNQRVERLNDCYVMTRLVMDAAFIIYKNDFARKKMFVFKAA